MMDESTFKIQLKKIGERLGPIELEQLCFITDIDSAAFEASGAGIGFVNHLLDRGDISHLDYSHLQDLLESIGCPELVGELQGVFKEDKPKIDGGEGDKIEM